MRTKKYGYSLEQTLFYLRTSTGLLALGAILALTPLRVLSFLIIMVVAARLLPFKSGIITRLAISYSLLVSIIGLIAVAAWFVNLPLNATVILILILALLYIALAINKKWGQEEQRSLRTDTHELAASALAFATMIFIAMPVLQNPNASQLLRAISAGGDNSAHMNMIKTDDLNQGIAYGRDNRVNTPDGALTYPQTWHFNVAFTKWMSDPLLNYSERVGMQLGLFYATAVLWFGLLVFFMARLGLRLAELTIGNKGLAGIIGVLAVCGGIAIHWLLQLFTYGFQTQTATLALVVAEMLILVQAFTLAPAKRYPLLLLATILAVGCNFVWVFVMPVTFGAIGLGLLLTIISTKKLPPLYFIVGFAGLTGLALVQPLLFVIFPVAYEFPMILQRGLINPTSMLALLTIMTIVIGYLVVRSKNTPLRITTIVAGGALAFSIGLMFYHLHTIHELRYFYYKSTYTFIVLGGPLLGVILADLIHQTFIKTPNLGRRVLLLLISISITATGLVWWQIKDPAAIQYTNGTLGGMSPQVAEAIINQVAKGSSISKGTTFIGSCNRGDDIRANQFITSLTPIAFKKGTSFDTGDLDERVVFNAIKTAAGAPPHPITIISSDQVVTSRLRAHLAGNVSNVTIIELDATPETEPITQCPDRIRNIQLPEVKV